ncbi:class I adenylate-forming enzyme family protein [Actinocorallia populi]|uniref:class I adenylate-forming enzyme family protein n=1 Tax=Actinocorallia populi TaxID=2079200 RepID=UPI000D087749|nr:class I adenylate-forming enzyme family protein [Actinocorallia populi]
MSELPGDGIVPRLERIADYLTYWSERQPDALFDESEGRLRTYRQAEADVDTCASALHAAGVTRGDKVAVLSTPRAEFLTLFLALSRIGAAYVGLNPAHTRDELLHIASDSGPVLLFGQKEHRGRDYTSDLAALHREVPSIRESHPLPAGDFLTGAGGTVPSPGDPREDALVVYTSGTTGRPKGVAISHRAFAEGCRLQAARLYHPGSVTLANLPVSHVGGVMDVVSVPLAMGGAIRFMDDFDPAAIPGVIEESKITLWGQIPLMFQYVLMTPQYADADLSSLKHIGWGGAPMPRETLSALRATGARLTSVYGLTESCVAVAYNDETADDESLTTTVGRPDTRLELRLAGEDGEPVPPGTPGEIQVRNACLMTGYLGLPEETAAAFTEDGFLRTGDLAVARPDGALTLIGRLKEMYKSGGYNVYPREIELVLERHPSVSAAAVVSVPDEVYTEVGVAFVVGTATAEELDAHCREHLASYKVPKRIELLPGLPLLPAGKADKAALREAALKCSAAPST